MIGAISLLAVAILAAADPPAARQIPGINAKDPYPKACVDCHVNKPDMPAPISADLKEFAAKVDPKLVAKIQPLAPKGVTLKGKHPNVTAMVKDIPAGCFKCHLVGSKSIPPFAPMIHEIHLTNDRFLTTFQGECTFCHKFNEKSGEWSVPSAAEK